MRNIFSPKAMLANTGKKLTTLSYVLYALSLIGGIVGSIVLIWFVYDWEGGEALIAAPFILAGGVLLGTLMGLLSAMPLKGFGVIVEYFENAQNGAVQASFTAPAAAQAGTTAPAPVQKATPAPAPLPTWTCSCGRYNPVSIGFCPRCGANKPR